MARGTPFWVALAIGGCISAFGAAGLVRSLDGPALSSYLTWWIAGLAAHDVLLAPGTALAGLLLARCFPARVRPPLQAAGYISATIVLASAPLLIGQGRQADNPSLQPNDYTANVLLVVTIVWAVAALLAIRRARRRSIRSGARSPR